MLEGFGLGAPGQAVGEVCFNTAMTGYEEILTDPSYAGRSSPSPSRTSATSAPTTRHRNRQHGGDAGRPRRESCGPTSTSRRTSAPRAISTVAARPRHHRPLRHRHPRADRAHPREGHAQRGDRARTERKIRPRCAEAGSARVAGPRRHGPRADGDERPAVLLDETPCSGARATAGSTSRNSMWSRSTTASSATSCGCWPASAARSRGAGQDLGGGHRRAQSGRGVSLQRPPAIRRRPGNTRCR